MWRHLWEFPLVETTENLPLESLLEQPEAKALLGESAVVHTPVQLKHVLSHQVIHARFIPVDVTFIDLPRLHRLYARTTLRFARLAAYRPFFGAIKACFSCLQISLTASFPD